MFYTSEKTEDIGTIDLVDELASFAWTLDWSACQAKISGEYVLSPAFSTLSDDGKVLTWKLQLFPDGVNRNSRGSVSLYLRALEEKKRGFLQKVVHFCLLSSRDEEINKKKAELYSQFKRDTCGLDQFIRRDLFEHNAADLLIQGQLTLICTMLDIRTEPKFQSTGEQADSPLPPLPKPRKNLGGLATDDGAARGERPPPGDQFEAMLESGRSDASVIAGGRSFCAHRAILAARSTYFRNSFEQDVGQRKRVSFVDMSEFSGDVVVEIMRYLYLDTVDKLEERASLLLAPANKYQLEKLKAQCEEVMIKELNVHNASEYLVLSFLHDAEKVREKAMDFVVVNSLDVINTPGFKAIAGSHANVIAAILKTITVKEKNKRVQTKAAV